MSQCPRPCWSRQSCRLLGTCAWDPASYPEWLDGVFDNCSVSVPYSPWDVGMGWDWTYTDTQQWGEFSGVAFLQAADLRSDLRHQICVAFPQLASLHMRSLQRAFYFQQIFWTLFLAEPGNFSRWMKCWGLINNDTGKAYLLGGVNHFTLAQYSSSKWSEYCIFAGISH